MSSNNQIKTMLWQICLTLLIIYGMLVGWKRRKLNKIHEKLPIKLKPVPILGHAVHFLGDAQERTKTLQRVGREAIDHDGISSFWLAHKLLVVIADPEAAEVVLKACLEKDEMMNLASHLIGNGSIMAPVAIWRPRRKLLAPTFTQKTLNSYVNIFSKQGKNLMDQLEKFVGKGNISIFENVTKYSMDSICETAFGIQVNSLRHPNHPVQKSFCCVCELGGSRLVKPWLYPNAIYKWTSDYPQFDAACTFLKRFVAQIIKDKRESFEKQNIALANKSENHDVTQTRSFLELLMEAEGGKGFTDLELQEETLVLLLAGTDTSATAVAFAAMLLAKHPDIQKKVYQEVKEVFGDSERQITGNDLSKLKYLDAVVRETLRLYPSAPMIVRKVEKKVTLPSGLTLVPGLGILIHIWATHRNPKYWGSDADVFRPERFIEGPLTHPCAYIPFSSGLRNCIGAQFAMMSIKTVLTHLVRRYRLLPPIVPNNTTVTNEELPVTFDIIMKHVDNFELQLELRNKHDA